MEIRFSDHFFQVLGHVYISPLERCNLCCKMCYTKKTASTLTQNDILEFVRQYGKIVPIQTVTLCGGEVALLPWFGDLVNELVHLGIFVQIITNGTIDFLDRIANPNSVNCIVSIDGLPPYHDKNRGLGMWEKSLGFLERATQRGFHIEIFSVVTRQNIANIDAFEKMVKKRLGRDIPITYHPRKNREYLSHHPLSNTLGEVAGFDFLLPDELSALMKTKKTFPPKNLGCFQIALMSDGLVYGCCEGTVPIGKISDSPETLIEALHSRLEQWEKVSASATCLGCSQPDFVCGLPGYTKQETTP